MAVLSLESVPVGFRFHPTDEELMKHHLLPKIKGKKFDVEVIRLVDLCKQEPWDLPELSIIKSDDQDWFFFSPVERKYPNGRRSKRATKAGYWKATGQDRKIKSPPRVGKVIGMKKTLVFYEGRAPKGKKTCWIIHEYRTTEEDLNGDNANQGAFVLCRLKKQLKTENSNCDEIEPTGLLPIPDNSSPDSMPSTPGLVNATPELDMQADKSDGMASDALETVDSHCSVHVVSDMEDHEAEGTAAEMDPVLEEGLRLFRDPTFEPLETISPLQSERFNNLRLPSMGSSFTNDFGNKHNDLGSQDGSSEPDDSFSKFLDSIIIDLDESCEESSSQKNSVVESEAPVGPGIQQPEYGNYDSICGLSAGGSGSDTDTEVAQMQHNPGLEVSRFDEHADTVVLPIAGGSFRVYHTLLGGEYRRGSMGLLQDDSLRPHASSTDSATDPLSDLFNGFEKSTSQKNPTKENSGLAETGIVLRTRQPQHQSSSHNYVTQGTAPRRILLQRKGSLKVTSCTKTRELSRSAEDHEVSPKVNKVGDATGRTIAVEPQETTLHSGITGDHNAKLKLRLGQDGLMVSDKSMLLEVPPVRHRCSDLASVYIAGVAIFILLFILFICPW